MSWWGEVQYGIKSKIAGVAFAAALLSAVSPIAAQSLRVTANEVKGVDLVLTDPCLGHRWVRIVDTRNPAGPARLIELGEATAATAKTRLLVPPQPSAVPEVPLVVPVPAALMIHSGDRVIVEQTTPQMTARFTATALESAAVGHALRVRLMAGANGQMGALAPIVTVVAVAAGQTRWPESASRRQP